MTLAGKKSCTPVTSSGIVTADAPLDGGPSLQACAASTLQTSGSSTSSVTGLCSAETAPRFLAARRNAPFKKPETASTLTCGRRMGRESFSLSLARHLDHFPKCRMLKKNHFVECCRQWGKILRCVSDRCNDGYCFTISTKIITHICGEEPTSKIGYRLLDAPYAPFWGKPARATT